MKYVNLGINNAIYTQLHKIQTQDIVYFILIVEQVINNYTFDYGKQIFLDRLIILKDELQRRKS
jgi:hypothetical protein